MSDNRMKNEWLAGALRVCSAATAALAVSCAGPNCHRLPASMESPGRLEVAAVPGGYASFDRLCREDDALLSCRPDGPEHIGHVFGSYQEYAMRLTSKGARPRKHRDRLDAAVDLMKIGFEELHLDAVEFDVHANPATGAVVILHNRPRWNRVSSWPQALRFTEDPRNTLRGLLDAFLRSYAGSGKHLYIELKTPNPCKSPGSCADGSCTRTAMHIAAAFEERAEALAAVAAQLTFVSFSAEALEAMHGSLSETLRQDRGFVLILGPSSGFAAGAASVLKGCCIPKFAGDETAWLKTTPWATGVWYSPRAIRDLAHRMAEINKERLSLGASCLSVGIATQTEKPAEFEEVVRESWEQLERPLPPCGDGGEPAAALIQSFIFDVDR